MDCTLRNPTSFMVSLLGIWNIHAKGTNKSSFVH
jgi:hypothetical protein